MENKKETALAFKNISHLLLMGVYSGQLSELVSQSIKFIDAIVKDIEAEIEAEEKKSAPATDSAVTEPQE